MAFLIEPGKKRGWVFRNGNQKLSSQYDPISEAENLIADYREQVAQTDRLICLGFFPVYHIALLSRINPNLEIVVVDDSSLNQNYLRKSWDVIRKDIASLPPFTELIFHSAHTLISFLHNHPDSLKTSLLLSSPYACLKTVHRIQKTYSELLEKDTIRSHTVNYFHTLWQMHTLTHLKNGVENFISSLRLTGEGDTPQTAFLLSSGPSLDELLKRSDDLVALSHRYPFISVPGISRRLLDKGIRLSAIFATDAGFGNTYHFMRLYPSPNLPLIAPLSIHPAITRNWKKTFFYWDMEEHHPFFEKTLGWNNFIPADASVVLSAIRFLSHLGCRRIITLGVDFAMTPFREHATSNTTQEILFNRNSRLNNFTSETYLLYHRQSKLIEKNTPWEKAPTIQNKPLYLYQKQFQKLRDDLRSRGVEISDIRDLSWEEYRNQPGWQLRFHSQPHGSRDLYLQVRDQFKQMFPPFITTEKEKWLKRRWDRL